MSLKTKIILVGSILFFLSVQIIKTILVKTYTPQKCVNNNHKQTVFQMYMTG